MEHKIGLATTKSSKMPESEQIKLFRKIGWEGFFTGWEPENHAEWARLGKELSMEYQSIHAPFIGVDAMWKNSKDGEQYADMLIRCAEDCARYEIPIMVIHPYIGFNFDEYIPTEAGINNFGKLIDRAEKLGIRLGIENVEGEPFLDALIKTFHSSPAVGFCLDTGHEKCYNRGKDMLALYGDKLCHTHFNDNMGVTGDTITYLDDYHFVMGDGIIDWENVMKRINKTGYDGILMCELTVGKRPGLEPLERYSAMDFEDFVKFAYQRAKLISNYN